MSFHRFLHLPVTNRITSVSKFGQTVSIYTAVSGFVLTSWGLNQFHEVSELNNFEDYAGSGLLNGGFVLNGTVKHFPF
jgi:hypothetical protein